MKTTLPATKARQQFFKLIEAADQPGRIITITVDGEPKTIMMSIADYESLQETLDIISDKALMKNIKCALEDVKKGKFYSEQEAKKRLGL